MGAPPVFRGARDSIPNPAVKPLLRLGQAPGLQQDPRSPGPDGAQASGLLNLGLGQEARPLPSTGGLLCLDQGSKCRPWSRVEAQVLSVVQVGRRRRSQPGETLLLTEDTILTAVRLGRRPTAEGKCDASDWAAIESSGPLAPGCLWGSRTLSVANPHPMAGAMDGQRPSCRPPPPPPPAAHPDLEAMRGGLPASTPPRRS